MPIFFLSGISIYINAQIFNVSFFSVMNYNMYIFVNLIDNNSSSLIINVIDQFD